MAKLFDDLAEFPRLLGVGVVLFEINFLIDNVNVNDVCIVYL